MRHRFWIVTLIFGAPLCIHAQWLHHPVPGTPRTADGKPNLAAPAPRTADGKPDLSGIWQPESSPISELASLLAGGINGLGENIPSKYFLNILADFKPEEAPLQLAAAEAYRKRLSTYGRDFQTTRCLPAGVPTGELVPEPFKLIQTPGELIIMYEADTIFRQIFTDGRQLPENPQPAWLGYSVGKWENETLVIDTLGFNDQTWLDAFGHTHSDALHVIERFHRRDFGHMDVEVRLEDPKTFTKPVTIRFTEKLIPDTELLEQFCAEGEKDAAHMKAN